MWLPFFVLLIAFKSSLAEIEDDLNECKTNVNFEDLENFDDFPDADTLDKICPPILDFITCVEDVLEMHTGFTLEDLESILEGMDEARYVTVLINIRRTFHDLCDKDSQLNKDYKANAQCLSRFPNSIPTTRCHNIAFEIAGAYEKIEDEVDDEAEDSDNNIDACTKTTYDVVCTGIEIHEKCGEHAFDTYMRIVKGTTLFRYGICNEKQLEDARAKFLDSVEMESAERELYKLAFDLKKRRK